MHEEQPLGRLELKPRRCLLVSPLDLKARARGKTILGRCWEDSDDIINGP